MGSEIGLPGLQRWLQSVIMHPGSTDEALADPEAAAIVPAARLESAVLPSSALTAAERVEVYHGMYSLRMSDALENDYPALAHFLGSERWMALVRDYTRDHPSTCYTLNALGRLLPEWLKDAPQVPRRGFCRDLARLEWAVTEAFDAEETGRIGQEELAAVRPDAWAGSHLVLGAAVRLLQLRWNANVWLDSTKDERHDHPRPRRHDSWVVVYRRSFSVYRRELSRPAFRLLADIAAGFSIGEAVDAALRRQGAPGAEALSEWFRQWAAEGLFYRIVPPDEPHHDRT